MRVALLVVSTIAIALTGCATSASAPEASRSSPSASTAAPPVAVPDLGPGKVWTVDTSGWWVPDDPTGCDMTTVCDMNGWPTRGYEGHSIIGVVRHGDQIDVLCKAPTPAAIRNDLAIDSENWVYTRVGDQYYWFADIYVTGTDLNGLVKDVPECPSNTPGIDG